MRTTRHPSSAPSAGDSAGGAGRPAVRRRLSQPRVQTKLTLGAPGDAFEQEADRVAEQVMRMPDPSAPIGSVAGARVQRTCAACAAAAAAGRPAPCPACAAQDETVQRQPNPGARSASTVGGATARTITGLHGAGSPLSAREKAYFEPRFGRVFDAVRIHTGGEAASAASSIQAKAFTYGRDIAFGRGQYRPGTTDGRRLLAHELTHVVQQGGAAKPMQGGTSLVRRVAPSHVQGDWIIDNHTRRARSGGPTDGDLIEGAFQQICPLTARSGNRIVPLFGPPPADRADGCACLRDIEADLASSRPILQGTPHIGLNLDGWSSTNPQGTPPVVHARHPSGSFDWGYWTGGQTRALKPFFRTVAHEICGHVVTLVRTGGAHAGGRGSPTGHNEAIKGENQIAAEHGVPSSQLRGMDRDAAGNPLPGHRGESFLQATVSGFAHGNAGTASTNLATVISDAVNTIATVQSTTNLLLMVQVEGFALRNEGTAVARNRVQATKAALITALAGRSGLLTPVGGRFRSDLTTVLPGPSRIGVANAGRRVHIYLFHKPHSAGP